MVKRTKVGVTTIEQLMEEQDHKCKRCSIMLKGRSSFHVDHIIPLAKGGKDDYSNYQLLCPICHKEKTKEDGYSGGLLIIKKNFSVKCKKCDKVIEGFSKKDLFWREGMHDLKHRKEEREKEEKEND